MAERPRPPYYGSSRVPPMAYVTGIGCGPGGGERIRSEQITSGLDFEKIVMIAQNMSDERVMATADMWQRIHDLMDQVGKDYRKRIDTVLGLAGDSKGWKSEGAAQFVKPLGDALQCIDAWRDVAGGNVGPLRALAGAISTFQREVKIRWHQRHFMKMEAPGRPLSSVLYGESLELLRAVDQAFADVTKAGALAPPPVPVDTRPSIFARPPAPTTSAGFQPGPAVYLGPTNARLVSEKEFEAAMKKIMPDPGAGPRPPNPGAPALPPSLSVPPPAPLAPAVRPDPPATPNPLSPAGIRNAEPPPPPTPPPAPAVPPGPGAPPMPPSLTGRAAGPVPPPPVAPVRPQAPASPTLGGRAGGPRTPGAPGLPKTPSAPRPLAGRNTPPNSPGSRPPSPQLPGRGGKAPSVPNGAGNRPASPRLPGRGGNQSVPPSSPRPAGANRPTRPPDPSDRSPSTPGRPGGGRGGTGRPRLPGRLGGGKPVEQPKKPSFGTPEMPPAGPPNTASSGPRSLRGRRALDQRKDNQHKPIVDAGGPKSAGEETNPATRPATFRPPTPLQHALDPNLSTLDMGPRPRGAKVGDDGTVGRSALRAGLTGGDSPVASAKPAQISLMRNRPKKVEYETNASDAERIWRDEEVREEIIHTPAEARPGPDRNALGGPAT